MCLRSLTVCWGNLVHSFHWTFGHSPTTGSETCHVIWPEAGLGTFSPNPAWTLLLLLCGRAGGQSPHPCIACSTWRFKKWTCIHTPQLQLPGVSAPVCPVPSLLLQQEGINKAKEHFHSIWNMTNDHQSANAVSLFISNYYYCGVSQSAVAENSGSSREFLEFVFFFLF